MKTVAIIQGWAGGHWHTKKFSRDLEKAGFKVVSDKQYADILIAHSAGCFDLPVDSQARLIMLINPPYWPGRSILARLLKKNTAEPATIIKIQGLAYWLKKKLWEGIYIFIKPSYTWLGLKERQPADFLDPLRNKQVLLVRNKRDFFCSPEIEKATKDYANLRYVELPGEHDDYYTNPKPYIDLLIKNI